MARNRGEAVPSGWLIDHDGQPATHPDAYLTEPRGAILPLGGVVGYKGTCLSLMVEILGGLLSGEGCAAGETVMRSNGLLLTAWDPEVFADAADYAAGIEGLVAHLMTSRVDPAVGRIQLPGGPEFEHAAEARRRGVPVDATTWARICERARGLDLDPEPWSAQATVDAAA